ncbi:MAG: 5-(carboxyamino)imidazole ribonucleotide synthase [Cellvibrionaceae bacterium]
MHIAIIGCGQLSRMLALAGIPFGFTFSFINDAEHQDTTCVEGLGEIVQWRSGDSFDSLYAVLGKPDIVTVEKEQVDIALLVGFQKFCPVYPDPKAFAICQDRYKEKQLLDSLDIPCSSYVYGQPLSVCVETLSLPLVIKSCRDGYDGKNQWVLKTPEDVEALEQILKDKRISSNDYIAEQWIPFDKEISLVSVRSVNGEARHYSLTENTHDKGILKQSIAPAPNVSEGLIKKAQDYLGRIVNELDYVGVIAMECFVTGEKLLINELAPRVHNSGHWTQSGSKTCQFENHLRAITGTVLGNTENHGVAGMVNLIGIEKPSLEVLSADSKLHWYNKSVRPGRKLGHVNFQTADVNQLLMAMNTFSKLSHSKSSDS